jgi:Putative restriction endonuclease
MRSEPGRRTEFLRTLNVFHRHMVGLTIVKNTAHDSRSEMLRQTKEEGFIAGPPELVVEVSKATRLVDLGPKPRDYERGGILEYVVRTIEPDEIFWYGQQAGALVRRSVGEDALYRSMVFPGLWLDPAALLNGDTRQLRAVVGMGCATPEHSAFLALLASRGFPS